MGIPYAEVIGDPIGHSKSPLIHRFWLERLGIEAAYDTVRVLPAELDRYFAERRTDPDWRGCNVTMPHKAPALSVATLVDHSARLIGSANLMVVEEEQLRAFNTDTNGITEALGPALPGRGPVVLLGTGGAARAALFVLRTQGVGEVAIVGRNHHKVEALAADFGLRLVNAFDPDGAARLLINATPLGMAGADPMPERMLHLVDTLPPDATVFDMIYAPAETELLSKARARGLGVIGGLDMLIGQADAAFARLFGEAAPRQFDQELREALA